MCNAKLHIDLYLCVGLKDDMNNNYAARYILRNKNKLLEMHLYGKCPLRNELSKKTSNDEENLIIKYRNGSPSNDTNKC